MNSQYRINVQSMCFTDELGMVIDLPESEELDAAVLLINKLCSDKVRALKTAERENFILKKWTEIKGLYSMNLHSEVQKCLLEISKYDSEHK